ERNPRHTHSQCSLCPATGRSPVYVAWLCTPSQWKLTHTAKEQKPCRGDRYTCTRNSSERRAETGVWGTGEETHPQGQRGACATGSVHRHGDDAAQSRRLSPLGAVCASWYSMAITLSHMTRALHKPAMSVLGESMYRGRRALIGITQADRLGHMWVLGKTGTGKSTFLTNMIAADMQAGRGLMVLDPHGDFVEALLDLVPLHRVAETVYVNPADTAYPLAFNPLDGAAALPPHLVATGMLAVLKKTWPEFWGPRMEYVLRSS